MRSWAVPKGPSTDPAQRRLAMAVEDHPMSWNEFEGVIGPGYGAGTVIVWDQGAYTGTTEGKSMAEALDDGYARFVLEGHKLRGEWSLRRMSGDNGKAGSCRSAATRSPTLSATRRGTSPESVVSGLTIEEVANSSDEGEHTTDQGDRQPREARRSQPAVRKDRQARARPRGREPAGVTLEAPQRGGGEGQWGVNRRHLGHGPDDGPSRASRHGDRPGEGFKSAAPGHGRPDPPRPPAARLNLDELARACHEAGVRHRPPRARSSGSSATSRARRSCAIMRGEAHVRSASLSAASCSCWAKPVSRCRSPTRSPPAGASTAAGRRSPWSSTAHLPIALRLAQGHRREREACARGPVAAPLHARLGYPHRARRVGPLALVVGDPHRHVVHADAENVRQGRRATAVGLDRAVAVEVPGVVDDLSRRGPSNPTRRASSPCRPSRSSGA